MWIYVGDLAGVWEVYGCGELMQGRGGVSECCSVNYTVFGLVAARVTSCIRVRWWDTQDVVERSLSR